MFYQGFLKFERNTIVLLSYQVNGGSLYLYQRHVRYENLTELSVSSFFNADNYAIVKAILFYQGFMKFERDTTVLLSYQVNGGGLYLYQRHVRDGKLIELSVLPFFNADN